MKWKKLNITLISVVTLIFLTGCIFDPYGIIEGTSAGETGKSSTESENDSTSSDVPTTTVEITTIEETTIVETSSISVTSVTSVDESTNSTTGEQETTFEISSTGSTEISDSGTSSSSTETGEETGENICGNFIIENSEECDDGLRGSGKCTIECTNSFCGDGIINAIAKEECDDTNNVDYDACSTDCYRAKWVFLTKNIFASNFGGIGEADFYCKKDAQAAGLAGNYKSWTSDMFPTNSPDPNWVNTEFKGWYRMPTDPPTLFAKGHSGLSSKIENPLNVLADGSKNISLTKVWTATLSNGKKSDKYGNCNSWQDMGFGIQGGIGNPQALDNKWTDDSGPLCGSIMAGIYCFEK